MNAPRLSLLLASSILTLAAAAQARANPSHAVEQLAGSLHAQAGQLSAEIRGHFRQTPNYRHLVADAQQINALSAQVQALARAHAHPSQLAGSIRRLEELVAALEDHVQEAGAVRRHVAYRHGGPVVAPCDTRVALRMLAGLDRTLANLDDAARDAGRWQHRGHDHDDDFGGRRTNYRGRGF